MKYIRSMRVNDVIRKRVYIKITSSGAQISPNLQILHQSKSSASIKVRCILCNQAGVQAMKSCDLTFTMRSDD